MPISCKLLLIQKFQFLSNRCQFTSANTLQTVAISQVPIPCTLLPNYNCQYLANCCQLTSANTLPTVADSQKPIPCKLLPIHRANSLPAVGNSQVPIPGKLLPIRRCQYLTNCCQFASANTLQTVAHSQGQFLANCWQFARANTLQTAANSPVPISCKLLPIHKCQYLANCCQFASAKPSKLLRIHNSQTRACKLLQFTSAKTLQTDINSRMPNKSLQTASIHKCQYLATHRHFTSAKPKPASANDLPAALNSSLDCLPCQ